jgi:hypothetical protein
VARSLRLHEVHILKVVTTHKRSVGLGAGGWVVAAWEYAGLDMAACGCAVDSLSKVPEHRLRYEGRANKSG